MIEVLNIEGIEIKFRAIMLFSFKSFTFVSYFLCFIFLPSCTTIIFVVKTKKKKKKKCMFNS